MTKSSQENKNLSTYPTISFKYGEITDQRPEEWESTPGWIYDVTNPPEDKDGKDLLAYINPTNSIQSEDIIESAEDTHKARHNFSQQTTNFRLIFLTEEQAQEKGFIIKPEIILHPSIKDN